LDIEFYDAPCAVREYPDQLDDKAFGIDTTSKPKKPAFGNAQAAITGPE
jgi:hypothetical protein